MLLKFAIQDFREDREYKNISKNTIGSYLLTLKGFQLFCVEQSVINVLDVTAQVVKSYLLHCQNKRGNNPTTRNSKLHTLKIFFNYLESIEVLENKKNPTKK